MGTTTQGFGDARWPPGTLLGDVLPEEQAELLTLGTQRSYRRGEVLLHEGDVGTHLLILLRGCVKILGTSGAGETVLLAVRLAGDMVGELSMIDGLPRSATVVTASPTTTVRSVSHSEFSAYLERRPSVATSMNRAVSLKLRQATRFRSDVSGKSVLVRLARVLNQLGSSYGMAAPAGGVLIDVQLTQTELAELIGAAEASIQRALGELRERGLVQTGYRQLLLRDVVGLRKLTAGED